jgi:hypothetical protein
MADELEGRDVVDPHGDKIGTIDELLAHGEDSWARVKMGVLGTNSALIPLRDAQQDGDDVRVVYEREHVKAAPEVEPEGDELSDEEVDKLHSHYGLERVKGLTAEHADDDIELPRDTRDAKPPGLDESPDNPLAKRRRKRQEELKQDVEDFEQIKQD